MSFCRTTLLLTRLIDAHIHRKISNTIKFIWVKIEFVPNIFRIGIECFYAVIKIEEITSLEIISNNFINLVYQSLNYLNLFALNRSFFPRFFFFLHEEIHIRLKKISKSEIKKRNRLEDGPIP